MGVGEQVEQEIIGAVLEDYVEILDLQLVPLGDRHLGQLVDFVSALESRHDLRRGVSFGDEAEVMLDEVLHAPFVVVAHEGDAERPALGAEALGIAEPRSVLKPVDNSVLLVKNELGGALVAFLAWRHCCHLLLVAGGAAPLPVEQKHSEHVLASRLLGWSGSAVELVMIFNPHPHDVAGQVSEGSTNRVFVVPARPQQVMVVVGWFHRASLLSMCIHTNNTANP